MSTETKRERKNCPDGEKTPKYSASNGDIWCKRYEEYCKFVTDCKHR